MDARSLAQLLVSTAGDEEGFEQCLRGINWETIGLVYDLKTVMSPVCQLARNHPGVRRGLIWSWEECWQASHMSALMLLVKLGTDNACCLYPPEQLAVVCVTEMARINELHAPLALPALASVSALPQVVDACQLALVQATPDGRRLLQLVLETHDTAVAPRPGYLLSPKPTHCKLSSSYNDSREVGPVLRGDNVSILTFWQWREWRNKVGLVPPSDVSDAGEWTEGQLFANAVNGPRLVADGCRMQLCQCMHEPEYDEVRESADEEDTWFHGKCDHCGQTIRQLEAALRIPLENGCWDGCYCSFSCLEATTNDQFPELKACVWLGIFANI